MPPASSQAGHEGKSPSHTVLPTQLVRRNMLPLILEVAYSHHSHQQLNLVALCEYVLPLVCPEPPTIQFHWMTTFPSIILYHIYFYKSLTCPSFLFFSLS